MSSFDAERSKQWNINSSSDPSSPQNDVNRDGPWKNFGTSMDAISFGLVATAILISMFLIMAIFEHLFKPSESFSSTPDGTNRILESRQLQKLRDPPRVSASYSSDFTVLMPGQKYPTFIAQPAPFPCQREGIFEHPISKGMRIQVPLYIRKHAVLELFLVKMKLMKPVSSSSKIFCTRQNNSTTLVLQGEVEISRKSL